MLRVMLKKMEDKLSEKSRKLKQIGVKHVTVKDAFDHFLRNNQSKHPKTIKDYYRFYNKFKESFTEKYSHVFP